MRESDLIFLISQPRSGSSLVQQMILKSDEVSASPEPWQMLALVSTYKNFDITEGYNQKFTSINFNRFLKEIDQGYEDYLQRIRTLSLKLYNDRTLGERYFLDKTPRYYHIIEELQELFPNAKFIFLVRNPLAVFASMLQYNFNGDIVRFLSSKDRIEDLFTAPQKIKNALQKSHYSLLVKYEDIVTDSKNLSKMLFKYLNIQYDSNITYELDDKFKSSYAVDNKSLQKHNKPVKDYLYSWKQSIDTTQKKKTAIQYLSKLKSIHQDYFGYELQNIIEELMQHKPDKNTFFNLGFDLLTTEEHKLNFKSLIWKRFNLKMKQALNQ
ncbi:sulfotransferase [Aureitalea sp. L0-47]|uniref:sulfotransferase family protein n=1 Tax=Aureitalea sp. L0-47 TaxID=2816962 RepID=UPI00223824D3|nr:sulfotransferase [Aureitalea sp. L0-47]MCW5519196.1 sulfotransferase [Aureitalea sp. L0-47]